jgi:hypothetical protein
MNLPKVGRTGTKSQLTVDQFRMLIVKERKTVSKTNMKKIRWSPSSSPNVVGYRLYWAVSAEVSYDSQFIDIGDRTEVILHDEVPLLHQVHGEVTLES